MPTTDNTDTTTDPKFLITYGRIGILPDGQVELKEDTIYFGGLAHTEAEAAATAREIVNTHARAARGSILPRVSPHIPGDLVGAMCDAQDWYESKVSEMNDSALTINSYGNRLHKNRR